MLAVILVLLQVFPFVYAAGTDPLWMTLLKLNKQWEGMYSYNETSAVNEQCSLTVHSAASVSFTSKHTSMDMTVSSGDNITVTFEEASVWNSTIHDAGNISLEFVGVFQKIGAVYHFVGNITSHKQKNLGTISFSPKGIRGRSNDDTRLRYGLAIGIPIGLAILLMVASVLILRWGIKKGYLRHVPWAYKYFTNPRRGQTDFEISDSNYNIGREQPEVHI